MHTRMLALTIWVSLVCAASAQAASPAQTYGGGVVATAMRNSETFLLLRKNGSTRLLAVRAGQPVSAAAELLAGQPGRELVSLHPAADGLYVLAREGMQAHILHLPARTNGFIVPAISAQAMSACRNCRSLPALRSSRLADITLPEGSIAKISADPEMPGFSVVVNAKTGTSTFSYKPSTGHLVRTRTLPLM